MKRIVYTLGLALGVSVASFAGVITSATGNLTGGGQQAINFEDGTAFPLGSFSSLPFNFLGNTVTIQTTIAATTPCSVAVNCTTYSTGTTAAIASGATGYASTLSGKYITTYGGTPGAPNGYAFSGGISANTNFTKTLTFTFANSISDFIISYFGSDGAITPGGAYLSTANKVTFSNGSTSVTGNLANQRCTNGVDCNTAGSGDIGYQGDVALAAFKVVTFTFDGADQGSTLNGDQVLFDNLRVFNAPGSPTTTTTTTTTTTVPPSGVPEPSTYALIGAGLVGMAFARRKK